MPTYFVWEEGGGWVSTSSAGIGSPLTTKGDLYGFSSTNDRVPVGTDGQVLTADSTQALGVKWDTGASAGVSSLDSITGAVSLVAGSNVTITDNSPSAGDITIAASGGGGGEINYTQITSSVNVTSTTEATPTTIISPGALTFSGADVMVEFFAFISTPSAATVALVITLFEGSTEIARIAEFEIFSSVTNQFIGTLNGHYRFTPSAGSHTYTIGSFVNATTGTPKVGAGSGGAGANPPAFVRFAYA